MEQILNAVSTTPEIFYGLHFVPGVAEYRPPGADPYRVFLSEKTIKDMDPTFRGKPVYVRHAEGEEDLNESDGWVVESFFNPCDGKTWAKFIAVSDAAKERIRQGWKLSNAYTPTNEAGGGLWNGVEYLKEFKGATYDHLALVPYPRYAESVILTPEQFKEYCDKKNMELARVANSIDAKGETMNFWKKEKVSNALDIENTMVDLPRSKSQSDLKTVINEADEYRLNMKLPQMANEEHHVEIGEGENKKKMTVGEMKNAFHKMCSEMEDMKKKNDAEAEERHASELEEHEAMHGGEGESAKDKAKNEDEMHADMKEKKMMDKKKAGVENEEADEKKKEIHADVKNEDEMKKKEKLFNELKHAHLTPFKDTAPEPDLGSNRVARGKVRYGSN